MLLLYKQNWRYFNEICDKTCSSIKKNRIEQKCRRYHVTDVDVSNVFYPPKTTSETEIVLAVIIDIDIRFVSFQ